MRWRGLGFSLAALFLGGLSGCVVAGPKPSDFGAMTRGLPPRPVCQHRDQGPGIEGRRAVVSCEGDARVDRAALRDAALAEARSMNPKGAVVLLTELTNPVDQFGVQCDAVPIVPWKPAGLVDLRWKQRVCRLVPAGPPGHLMELVVQLDGPAGLGVSP